MQYPGSPGAVESLQLFKKKNLFYLLDDFAVVTMSVAIHYENAAIEKVTHETADLLKLIIRKTAELHFEEADFVHLLNMFINIRNVVIHTNENNQFYASEAWIEAAKIAKISQRNMKHGVVWNLSMFAPLLKSLKIHNYLRKVVLTPLEDRNIPTLAIFQDITVDLEKESCEILPRHLEMIEVLSELIQLTIQFSVEQDSHGVPLELRALDTILKVIQEVIELATPQYEQEMKSLVHQLDPFFKNVIHSLSSNYLMFCATVIQSFFTMNLTPPFLAILRSGTHKEDANGRKSNWPRNTDPTAIG